MTTAAWVIVGVAALAAAVAARFARRSRLALAIAVCGAVMAVCAILLAGLGYGGCSDRGDCGPVGDALRYAVAIGIVVQPLLLVAAGVVWAWGRARGRDDRIPPLRGRDGRLAVCGVALLLFGLIMLALLPGHRVGGVVVALFGGACVCGPLSTALARRAGGAPRLDRVEHDGVLSPALVIAPSPVKLRTLRAGIGCFFAASLVMALAPHALASETVSVGRAAFAGWLGTITFGAAGLISLAAARRPQRVTLLPAGLRWEPGARARFAAWDDIESVEPFSIRGTRYLGLELRPGAPDPGGGRLLQLTDRVLARSDASLAVELLPVEPRRLAKAIAHCCASQAARDEIGTERSLEWLAPTDAGDSRRGPRDRPTAPRLPRPAAR
jgi:hypothetical protein